MRTVSLLPGLGLRARPIPREFQLQVAVVAHLERRLNRGWAFNHPGSGERRDARTAAKLKAMGLRPGRPDLELISPVGLYYGLELKDGGGQRVPTAGLNDEQLRFRSHCIAYGWPYAIGRSLDDALAVLEGWGAIGGTTA